MANILNDKSEYIRKSANQTQNVSTRLNFTGNVSVPLATAPTHPVRLSQIEEIKNAEFQKLKNQVTNIQLDEIKTCELEFNMLYARGVTLGSSSYYGSLSLIPLLEDGTRLYCVAWTKYLKSNLYYPQDNTDYAIVWLSEQLVESNLQSDKRVIEDPENLTDADIEYFSIYGGVENLLPVKVFASSYPTNFYNWISPQNGFKSTIERCTLVTSQNQVNMGFLSSIDLAMRFEMPATHPVFKMIKGLQIMPIACSAIYATANIYGVAHMSYKKTFNKKYVDEDVVFPNFLRNHSIYTGVYTNIPFVKDARYNHVVYDSTIRDSNILFKTDTYKIALKGMYFPEEDDLKLKFAQYDNVNMTNADPDWWRDESLYIL